jgi:8-oxo-dGTP pyrophosphatase MutT (NUDIX family)
MSEQRPAQPSSSSEDRPSFQVPETPPEQIAPARDSATVILARDGANGLEVFMLERHLNSDFAGGAYVFPGGTLDDRDLDPALWALVDGPTPDEAAKLLGVDPDRALGFYTCAIRETFEEAGALLARRDGEPVGYDERLEPYRAPLANDELTLLELAEKENLRYAADLLHYYSHWVTPELAPKRYTTRFFVAAFPDEAERLLHDMGETTNSRWVSPSDALEQGRAGTFTIIFPTRKHLEQLAGFSTVDDLVASTAGKEIEEILPRVAMVDGALKVILGDDPTPHDP